MNHHSGIQSCVVSNSVTLPLSCNSWTLSFIDSRNSITLVVSLDSIRNGLALRSICSLCTLGSIASRCTCFMKAISVIFLIDCFSDPFAKKKVHSLLFLEVLRIAGCFYNR